MHISRINIKNFRRLFNCEINIGEDQTLFVGANNSGKTSAMEALRVFLPYTGKDSSENSNNKIKRTDITLSNWLKINEIVEEVVVSSDGIDLVSVLDKLVQHCPSLDLWIDAKTVDLYRLTKLLPSLEFSEGDQLGVRFQVEPRTVKDIENNTTKLLEELIKDFREAKNEYGGLHEKTRKVIGSNHYSDNLYEFFSKVEFSQYFKINAYVLDYKKSDIAYKNLRYVDKPLDGIIKINVINAQRSLEDESRNSLSSYFKSYNNDVIEKGDSVDEELLTLTHKAKMGFDSRLENRFKNVIGEIHGLGYPSFTDPSLKFRSRLNVMDGINHKEAVQYNFSKTGDKDFPINLPEGHNGLGYQNLVAIAVELMRFRDVWSKNSDVVEPILLVLIEEPEAHLHVQVQQIFIEKAYQILIKDISSDNNVQMVVSTHSSSVAHSCNFSSIKYFKRHIKSIEHNTQIYKIPHSSVYDLKSVFVGKVNRLKNDQESKKRVKSEEDQTREFVTRYIRAKHCDLFFADAIIFVEGAAERMMLPHFIENEFNNGKTDLTNKYISIIDIGGSHAHRFKELVEVLDIPTLIITDLDSEKDGKKHRPDSVDDNIVTSNDTIKKYANQESIKSLSSGFVSKHNVYVSFQKMIDKNIPYTFEDALVLSNVETFKHMSPKRGELKKICDACNQENLADNLYKIINSPDARFTKAEFISDILFSADNLNDVKSPNYIHDGLKWLSEKLEIESTVALNFAETQTNTELISSKEVCDVE